MEESAWELSKENIQPLKQGRQPSILSKALRVSTVNVPNIQSNGENQSNVADGSTNSSSNFRALLLQQEKQEFEDKLKTVMSSDDPLGVYYRYIRFTEETCPAGKEKEIKELSNKCLKSMTDEMKERYANDIRYLYVWLKFASLSRSMGSLAIYDFMQKQGHCVRLAGFYSQWANELETAARYDEAAKIFQTGIQMEAQPLPFLVTAYEEFQVRSARRLMEERRKYGDDEEDDATRNVLGVLKSGPVRSAASGAPVPTPFMRQSKVEEVKCGKAIPTNDNRPGVAFAIYDESQENNSMAKATAISKSTASAKIPCEKKICKENIQDAGVWTKAKIEQAPFVKKTSIASGKIPVFVDDSAASASASVFESANNLPKKSLSTTSRKSTYETTDGAIFMCCMENIYDGSKEMSFEELRAVRWRKKNPNGLNLGSQKRVTASLRPPTTPFGVRPALVLIADPLMVEQQESIKNWKQPTISSPPGNTSFTERLYKDAVAAFSDTLHLSGLGRRSTAVDTTGGRNSSSIVAIPKENAGGAGFAIFEDPQTGQIPKELADKENIDPKINFGAGVDGMAEKKRRHVTGILCASTEFPIFDEKNKDNYILVEDDDVDGVATSNNLPWTGPALASTTVGNYTMFDLNESTVAGFQRYMNVPANRAISTPCHNLSRINPLSLSSLKPWELALAEGGEETENIPRVLITETEDRENHQAAAAMADSKHLSADTAPKNNNEDGNNQIENKLSTIAETSREYRSSSSSSSCTTATLSSGNPTRRRLLSGASGLPSISEAGMKMTLAFNTPYSEGGFGNGATGASGDGMDCESGIRCQITPYHEKGSATKAAVPKSHAVRKLMLNDENDGSKQDCVSEYGQAINPWSAAFVNYQLVSGRRLEAYTNFHTFEETLPLLKAGKTVSLGGETYSILGLVGEGAYAQVYKCNYEQEEIDLVLKVQKPCCPLEFAICHELHYRLKSQNLLNVVEPGLTLFKDAFMFLDGSVLVGEYSPYGTLVDLVNVYKQISSERSPPEIIVAYITADILRIMEAVHSQKIIHGDVKPDNFLVLDGPTLDSDDDISKVRSVRLIDWGRSIDMALVNPTTTFSGQSNTSGFICCEMQDGRPWTYQTDYYGILGTIHVLAFGNYMSTYKVTTTNRWRATCTFKRRWDDRLWREFFDEFLNVPDCSSLPSLSVWRKRFDDFVNKCRSSRPKVWTSEVQKMRDVLVELKTTKAKRKKLV